VVRSPPDLGLGHHGVKDDLGDPAQQADCGLSCRSGTSIRRGDALGVQRSQVLTSLVREIDLLDVDRRCPGPCRRLSLAVSADRPGRAQRRVFGRSARRCVTREHAAEGGLDPIEDNSATQRAVSAVTLCNYLSRCVNSCNALPYGLVVRRRGRAENGERADGTSLLACGHAWGG